MNKIKILHTADIHLNCAFSGLPLEVGRHRRNDLRETFKKVIQLALSEKVDLVFLAGDIFELARFSKDTINFIKSELEKLSHQLIFITPGNHDPYIEKSPYTSFDWPDNVHIFKNNYFEKVSIDKFSVDIFGIAHKSYDDRNNYLKDLKLPHSDKLQIVLMHGSDLGSIPAGKGTYFSFSTNDVFNCNADYLALGHYHGYKETKAPSGKIIASYSGSPEILGFDEIQEKGVIIAEISKQENIINLKPVKSRDYFKEEINCSNFNNKEQLIEKLKDLGKNDISKESIFKIILTGQISPYLESYVPDIEEDERLKKLFYFIKIENKTSLEYNLLELMKEKTVRGEFVRKLTSEIETCSAETPERKVLEQALYYGLDAFMLPVVKERL